MGTVTWTASKPFELAVLRNDSTHHNLGPVHVVPLIAEPSGTVAMTPTGPIQFSPASDPVPSGKAPFVGNILAFHTLSGAKFIVTYANHALNNSQPISAVANDKNETLVEK